jgi:hypothetical protein
VTSPARTSCVLFRTLNKLDLTHESVGLNRKPCSLTIYDTICKVAGWENRSVGPIPYYFCAIFCITFMFHVIPASSLRYFQSLLTSAVIISLLFSLNTAAATSHSRSVDTKWSRNWGNTCTTFSSFPHSKPRSSTTWALLFISCSCTHSHCSAKLRPSVSVWAEQPASVSLVHAAVVPHATANVWLPSPAAAAGFPFPVTVTASKSGSRQKEGTAVATARHGQERRKEDEHKINLETDHGGMGGKHRLKS